MTREDAINYFKWFKDHPPNEDKAILETGIELFDMAIKALEQEPCEDAISRQTLIDVVTGEDFCNNFPRMSKSLKTIIQALPNVQPKQEPCEDCISREAVIKLIDSHTFDTVDGVCLDNDITCILEELPSVQPTRPHGEVVNYQEETPNGFQRIKYICSNCGAELQGVTRPHGEWIPISERLPEEYANVICCTDAKEVFIATYLGKMNDGTDCFDDADGMMWEGDVIVWMPLPEPYKAEGEE